MYKRPTTTWQNWPRIPGKKHPSRSDLLTKLSGWSSSRNTPSPVSDWRKRNGRRSSSLTSRRSTSSTSSRVITRTSWCSRRMSEGIFKYTWTGLHNWNTKVNVLFLFYLDVTLWHTGTLCRCVFCQERGSATARGRKYQLCQPSCLGRHPSQCSR